MVDLCHFCFLGGENYIREIVLMDGYSEEHADHVIDILKKIVECVEKIKISFSLKQQEEILAVFY